MPHPFPRSSRRLNLESRSGSWWLPLTLATLLLVWLLWAALARVTIYAVSDSARLEVLQAACPVETSLAGSVAVTRIVLDASVQAGDVLVELDAEPLRFERNELRARLAGRAEELGPVHDEIQALQRQLDDLEQAANKVVEEQGAAVEEAEAALRLAASTAARSQALNVEGLVSPAELSRVQADVDQQRAGVGRRRATQERLVWDRRAEASELRGKLAECRRREVVVRGECAVVEASLARLEHELERRTIRAPIAGRLGETANLRAGQFVAAGTRLATIVPGGGIRIVAAFRPQDALGRIRAGQAARLRLHGFPWTEYGFVPARVASLASEALAGTVRVEADIAPTSAFPLPLQHGWPGTLEIEVDRIAPATLVLRAAGAWLARPGESPTPAEAR
ncbi:MAG: HlyD family efflux transporter periplasmic adaptor subunit [Planctomycetes bacterium]|nr:HlyD family efflux transporter periplasmic adaptor subunit [Planctomycetota bacterium]